MTNIVLFSSVLGIRQGERDAVARLEAAGHRVWLPDLLDGLVFDEYEPAMAHSEELGNEELFERGLAVAADVPDGFVVAGFSQGSAIATFVATRRPVSAVLQFAGVNIVEWFGPAARWPSGVDSQVHWSLDDPFRENQFVAQATADVRAAGGRLEFFDYPGAGHLFTDPNLPAEYDAQATELMWTRVLPFIAERADERARR